VILNACKKSDTGTADNTPYNPTYLQLKIPAGWPQPIDIYANNPLTEEGFQLGRKLFYDGKLSKDGFFPCASCHQQFAAFATYDHDFSHGYNNSFTYRSAPATFNLAWMPILHWDGAINNIEVQPLAPMTAPNEMAENIDSVLIKLRKDANYPSLFKGAFGTTEINSQRMLRALAQYTGSLISADSKYDKYKRGEATFTFTEMNGYNLFKAKCEACHKEPLFTDNSFRNNGLTVNPLRNDYGRMRITNNPGDSLKFKVPTLRNIVSSFPYMHDGRLYTLGQVLDHYSTGIQTNQPTLDPLLVNRIPMTNSQKNDLLFFLYTLQDTAFINNKTRFGPY
jgi:cytochrome c peroxidase